MTQEGYPRTLKGNRNRKRSEAAVRQQEWANLSLKQQLAELDKRPGECKKQRAKIARLMEQEKTNKN